MALSGVLRDLRDLVQRRQFAAALAQVNTQIAANPAPRFKTQLLGFAADTLFIQGKFTEAATTYQQVAQLSQTQPLQWLRPALGEVRSLLKDNQVVTAQERAITAVQRAVTLGQQYQAQLAQANATITAGGQAVIPAQPPAPAEVANRLAKQFFSEGEIAAAKALFQQSLQLSPNSCHARMGLAEIALRESNGALAAQLSREAITMGLYRSKTLPAWNLLLAAGRKLGTDKLDTPLLNGLAQATPKVRARAVLLIAGGLRGQGDARWQTIASNWLTQSGANHPKIAAELRKLQSSHARLTGAPLADQLQAAQAVLLTPKLSPNEWLAATKETVRLQFQLNQAPQLDALITQGETRFGVGKRARFIHGLALACKKAGQNAFAIQLLQRNVINATGPAQVHAQWALAQLQAAQGDHAGAAQGFWAISQNTGLHQRKRLYALMQWTREIAAANQPELIAQAKPQIEAALPQLTDYEFVLDLSRLVSHSKLGREFALQVYARGKQLAEQSLMVATNPDMAATVLFKLCRRANDLDQYESMIFTWTQLSEAKRNWLWQEKTEYWEWLELVFRAYRDSNKPYDGEAFVLPILADVATPPHGIAMLGVSFSAMKRSQGDFTTMFAVHEKMIQVAPTNEWTSVACYWAALKKWRQNNPAQTAAFADKMLVALGKDWKLGWKRKMAACAYGLKAMAQGIIGAQIIDQPNMPAAIVQEHQAVITRDLSRLML